MSRRFPILLAASVSAGAAFGGLFGGRVLATDDAEKHELERFARLVDTIEASYPDAVDSEDAVFGAIRGLLRTLDPHSNFLDPKTYQSMREEQRGHFSGLGIVVTKKGDSLTVISPIEDTPAYRLGIRAGDIISKIEGLSTADMLLDEAVSRLKGPKGTQVTITIVRLGTEPFTLTITRDDISTRSTSRAFLLRPGVGYLRIKNFTQTTTDEVTQALRNLEREGMETLLLDLRSNPGGLLDQAVQVADLFVAKGQTIVYTKGRLPNSNQSFAAETPDRFEGAVVVLVNQGSASASEIVSGAIQDHDRGLIVGETTWGKGLVQSVYTLRYGAGLALTTAKYYTPSGRCIQRDYSHSFDEYYDYDEATTHEPDLTRPAHTDIGRTVYGGGGITPDVIVPTPKLTDFEQRLQRADAFFRYTVKYLSRHPNPPRDFVAGNDVLDDFRAFLGEEKIEFTAEELARDRAYVKGEIEERTVAAVYGLDEGARRAVLSDPQVARALELIPQARELREKARLIAERGPRVESKSRERDHAAGLDPQPPVTR